MGHNPQRGPYVVDKLKAHIIHTRISKEILTRHSTIRAITWRWRNGCIGCMQRGEAVTAARSRGRAATDFIQSNNMRRVDLFQKSPLLNEFSLVGVF